MKRGVGGSGEGGVDGVELWGAEAPPGIRDLIRFQRRKEREREKAGAQGLRTGCGEEKAGGGLPQLHHLCGGELSWQAGRGRAASEDTRGTA